MVNPMPKKEMVHWLQKIRTNFLMNNSINHTWEGFKALEQAIEQTKYYPDVYFVDNVMVIDIAGCDVEACIIKNGSDDWTTIALKNKN